MVFHQERKWNMDAELILNEVVCKLSVVSSTLKTIEENPPNNGTRMFLDSISGARMIVNELTQLVLEADTKFCEMCKACSLPAN